MNFDFDFIVGWLGLVMVALWFYDLWICGIWWLWWVWRVCGVGIRQKFGGVC